MVNLMFQLLSNLTSRAYADRLRHRIDDSRVFDEAHYRVDYEDFVPMTETHGTSHLSIVAPCGDAVAVTTSINK